MFLAVTGIFEYDGSLRERGQYRQFFRTVRMQEVLEDMNNEIKAACQFLYRLKYLRDIMLHPTIDDPGVSAINSMITFTSSDIASQVCL